MGHTQYDWDFLEEIPEKIPERPRNTLRAFPGIPLKSTAGIPNSYHSRHLKAPEHFQNSLPPSTAGDACFFRSGSGEGLSEPVMEFLALLGFLMSGPKTEGQNPPKLQKHQKTQMFCHNFCVVAQIPQRIFFKKAFRPWGFGLCVWFPLLAVECVMFD